MVVNFVMYVIPQLTSAGIMNPFLRLAYAGAQINPYQYGLMQGAPSVTNNTATTTLNSTSSNSTSERKAQTRSVHWSM
jgi:hypothetical protein